MLTLGIDDAGRGPLIGPMILGGVLATGEQERKLKKENIRDSKDILQGERVRLSKMIKENVEAFKIVKTFPDEIDSSGNLNTLEAKKMAGVVNALNVGKFRKEKIKVVVDCPSTNVSAWRSKLLSFIEHDENLTVVCEHKADVNHVSVSAASILAKVVREEEVAKIQKKYGAIGSGYPADPTTKEFLKKHGKEFRDSGIFRKSWNTWKKMFPGVGQATLEGF